MRRGAEDDLLERLVDRIADRLAEGILRRVDERLNAPAADGRNHVPLDAYRPEQAAQALGLSTSEVRRRVNTGELASRRVGRAVLIPRSAIETFLANGTAT